LSVDVRTRVIIDGVVQGVWFRASTQREAAALGLAGWVRNLPDGRVEAVFEGPAESVLRMVEWCRRGPDRAIVTSVQTYDETPEGLRSFAVR
jgi:acylphosphatase